MHTILTLSLLLLGLPTLAELEAPDESVEISGALVVAPVISHTTDIPEFQVTFTSDSPATFTAPRLQPRSGIILDGQEYTCCRIFRWAGIVNTIEPGDVYSFQFDLGTYLPGAQRRDYSKRLKRWRWDLPLAPGTHRIAFFLRKTSEPDSERITSNEVVFVWDDSQPLLYE